MRISSGMRRKRSNDRHASHHLSTDLRVDRRTGRHEHVHSRPKLHDPESPARLDRVALTGAADDATGEDADDLTNDNRLSTMIYRHLGVFVEVPRVGSVRRQESAGMIL